MKKFHRRGYKRCFLTPVLTGSSNEGQHRCVFSAFGSPSFRYVINLNIGQTEKKVKRGFDRDKEGAYTCKI